MNVKPLHATLILIFYGALLAAVIWTGNQWRLYQGPDFLAVNQQGHLFATVRDRLLEFDDRGQLKREHSLQALGVTDALLGGVGFFSNGDVLLRPGQYQPTLWENLLRNARYEGTIDAAHAERLHRCSLERLQCKPLPGLDRHFSSTFRSAIDAQNTIFLADTQAHQVLWLTADGDILDSIDSDLTFPNQLVVQGDQLAIANTNHNELLLVPLQRDSGGKARFGPKDSWQHFSFEAKANRLGPERWPAEVAFLDGHWYVLVQGDNMANGAVYRLDADGKPDLRFGDEAGSDNIGMAVFGDDLLVADWAKLEVRRYSPTGEDRGKLASPAQTPLLGTMASTQAHYRLLSTLMWILFGFALLAGVVIAVILELRHQRQQQASQQAATPVVTPVTTKPHPREGGIVWLSPGKSMLILFKWVLPGMIVLLPLFTLLPLLSGGSLTDSIEKLKEQTSLLLMVTGMVLTMLPVVWYSRRMFQRRIGVKNEWLLLEDHTGKVVIGTGADVLVNYYAGGTPVAVQIDDVFVPLGQPHQRLFDQQLLEKHVIPLLGQARTMTSADHMANFKRQLRNPAFVVMMVLMLAGMLLFALAKNLDQ